MTAIGLHAVSKSFGKTVVINATSLDIYSGEFLVLVGPSGCGKSTMLRMISGLEPVSGGAVLMDGVDVSRLGPNERGVAMVFQSYALYPHMTVRENLSFGMKLAKRDRQTIMREVGRIAELLRLGDQLDKKPGQLSGGQKQRVAIGRAIIRQPKVFLFDEPLSNLDAQLRMHMRAEISQLHRQFKTTSIYVTHDQVEAMSLADRIAVINGGRIEQLGTPQELFHHPKTKFVAGFLGTPPMSFLPIADIDAHAAPAEAHCVGFRTQDVRLDKTPADNHREIALGEAEVHLQEYFGATVQLHMRLSSGAIISCERPAGADLPRIGERLHLLAKPEALKYFDERDQCLN